VNSGDPSGAWEFMPVRFTDRVQFEILTQLREETFDGPNGLKRFGLAPERFHNPFTTQCFGRLAHC
jgi:hypothetical protein